MEFVLFMSQVDKEIIELIKNANYTIEENTALCLIGNQFVGFHKKREKEIVICTENAKNLSNYKESVNIKNNENHKTKHYLHK